MAAVERTDLQERLSAAIIKSERTRDSFDNQLRKLLGTTGKPLWDIERGKVKKPSPRVLRAIEEVFGFKADSLVDLVHPRSTTSSVNAGGQQPVPSPDTNETVDPASGEVGQNLFADQPDMVGIQMIDLAYGLGATYADSSVEVSVVEFPKVWIEQITHSPPAHLTWTRGRGDSMSPTIEDGDMVLLDRSRRKVEEQDAMWAFAIGDINAIKRLRVKGDRYQIFSDNPSVPPDEEPQDFVNIVARVVFVGRRK